MKQTNLTLLPEEQLVEKTSANFFDVNNTQELDLSQESLDCKNEFVNRYNKLISLIDWDYSSPESFWVIVSQLKNYWVFDNDENKWQDIVELTFQLREWNFSAIEDLFLVKIKELIKTKDDIELIIKFSELIHLTFGITQLFDVISLNTEYKPIILQAVKNLQIYFTRLLEFIESRLDKEVLDGFRKELNLYIDVVDVIYDSEIDFNWNDSKQLVEDTFNKKYLKIQNLKQYFKENNENSYTYLRAKEQFLSQSSLLSIRLELQLNSFQQSAYFNTKCKEDKKQYNLTDLIKEHSLWVLWLMKLYSQKTKNNFHYISYEHDTNKNEELNQLDISRGNIQAILDDFLLQLKNNDKDIGILFEIVESILYFSTYVNKEMVWKFQKSINSLLNRNPRFLHWDLHLFDKVLTNLYEEKDLKEKTKLDWLTGVLNREVYDQEIITYIDRADRLSWYKGMMVIDIDHFKKVNDTYWHASWDAVLVTLCEVVLKNIRPSTDKIFRYWWEEFVILFECEWSEDAQLFAEKIRKVIQDNVISSINEYNTTSSVRKSLESLKELTVSIWYTQLKNKDKINTEELKIQLFNQADKALYYSKENWRNQVTQYTEELDK